MKLIVVTPAGRERYLRLLSHYVLRSPRVAERHLWDNGRAEFARLDLHHLAASDARCKIKEFRARPEAGVSSESRTPILYEIRLAHAS